MFLNIQDPNQKQMYQRGMFNDEHPEEIREFFKMGVRSLAAVMKNWPEMSKYVRQCLSFNV